jgi:hypothetical protein
MIACASPSSAYFDETWSTLKYAARTMKIKNKPTVQVQNLMNLEHLSDGCQRANHLQSK